MKDFNVLIDGKSFFDMPIKNKDETYEEISEMGRNTFQINCNRFKQTN